MRGLGGVSLWDEHRHRPTYPPDSGPYRTRRHRFYCFIATLETIETESVEHQILPVPLQAPGDRDPPPASLLTPRSTVEVSNGKHIPAFSLGHRKPLEWRRIKLFLSKKAQLPVSRSQTRAVTRSMFSLFCFFRSFLFLSDVFDGGEQKKTELLEVKEWVNRGRKLRRWRLSACYQGN